MGLTATELEIYKGKLQTANEKAAAREAEFTGLQTQLANEIADLTSQLGEANAALKDALDKSAGLQGQLDEANANIKILESAGTPPVAPGPVAEVAADHIMDDADVAAVKQAETDLNLNDDGTPKA